MSGTSGAPTTVIVSQLPPPVHGSAIMTLHLRDALETLGRDVTVVDKRFSRDADDVGVLRVGKIAAIPDLLRRLAGALRTGRPDECVYFLTSRPASFLVDVAALALLRRHRVPVVIYIHTVGYSALASRGPLWRLLVRRAFASARTVVTLGPKLVADLDGLVRADRIHVVPNTSGDSPIPEAQQDERSRVLFLSNLLPEKGVDAFVRTAAALVASHPDIPWTFDIAGAGSPRRQAEVAEAVSAAGLSDRCAVHGAVGPEEKWRLLQRAAMLVFPSTYALEAQPLTIVEALSVGTPVVAYDTGGVGDLVVPGETGELVDPGDESALVRGAMTVRTALADARYREGVVRFHGLNHSREAFRRGWSQVLQEQGTRGVVGIDGFATDPAAFRRLVAEDWRANPRNWKTRFVLVAFRLAQLAMRDPERPRLPSVIPVALYRIWTETMLGMELRPKTRVGGGLTIWHGFALVVNDHAEIGRDVTLRNGVTIGQRRAGGPCPTIGDGVEVGAGALILGAISIGDGARIGAGAVVLADVPPGWSAVGNPARLLPPPGAVAAD